MLKLPTGRPGAHRTRHARGRFLRLTLTRVRANRLALGVVALSLVAVVSVIAATDGSPTATSRSEGHTIASPAGQWTTSVSVDASGAIEGTLNDHYIGLSLGTNELNTGKLDTVGNLTALLKNLGTSVMRFGGIVADQHFTGITPQALSGLARLAKASGWKVNYTENIGQFDSARVATDAAAVSHALGKSLAVFACGNEPEYFYNDGVKPESYSIGDYLSDAANCIEAIDTGAPNAPIEGPDTVTDQKWPGAYATAEAGIIKWFGIHFYPLPCGLNGETPARRAAELLSQSQIARELWWLNWAKADANSAKASLWMTEVNTACGGGDPGLSNTFASALWVIDYLLTGAEHGVAGMNIQGGLDTCEGYQGYSPLCEVSSNEYEAEPIYYGMLFSHLLGTGKLLPVTISGGASASNYAAFALKSATGDISVIIENFGRQQASIGLGVPATASNATVLHLTAPSLMATSGVNIQGSSVDANGNLKPGKPDIVRCSTDECPITIGPYSAVLVKLSR